MLCNLNFAKFLLQSMSSKIEQAFEKTYKPCFCLHFANLNLKLFVLHFFKISYMTSSLNLCDDNYFSHIKKSLKIRFFRKVQHPMKPTGRYCFLFIFLFHSQDPKPKPNHQIASSRPKISSRQSQTFVKYMGNIICIKRKTDQVRT